MDTHHPDGISNGYDPNLGPDDDEFWTAFDEAEEWAANRPTPWYRKTARIFGFLFVVGMFATGALIPWGELVNRLDNIEGPVAIKEAAEEIVVESELGWLVSEIRIRNIPARGVAGFVHSSPADGIVTLDNFGWDPEDLRSTVEHEIGHLLDFAAYGNALERRDGLESEVWAECAAVDAGARRTDGEGADQQYRCTPSELEQYQFSVSLLGEVCAPWSGICRTVTPTGG